MLHTISYLENYKKENIRSMEMRKKLKKKASYLTMMTEKFIYQKKS